MTSAAYACVRDRAGDTGGSGDRQRSGPQGPAVAGASAPGRAGIPGARRARFAGEPAVLRVIAPLALLVVLSPSWSAPASATCWRGRPTTISRPSTARHWRGAVEALQAAIPDLGRRSSRSSSACSSASRVSRSCGSRPNPPDGDREVQSVLDRKGRIVGWFSWEPSGRRPRWSPGCCRSLCSIVLGLDRLCRACHVAAQPARPAARQERAACAEARIRGPADRPAQPQSFLRAARSGAWRRAGRRRRWPCAVLDLDGFDEVNDALGYAGGDEVLVEIGKRLRDGCRRTRSSAASAATSSRC